MDARISAGTKLAGVLCLQWIGMDWNSDGRKMVAFRVTNKHVIIEFLRICTIDNTKRVLPNPSLRDKDQ